MLLLLIIHVILPRKSVVDLFLDFDEAQLTSFLCDNLIISFYHFRELQMILLELLHRALED